MLRVFKNEKNIKNHIIGEFKAQWREIDDHLEKISIYFNPNIASAEQITIRKKDGTLRKPSVAIFSCNVGSGHNMATQAMMQYLPDCHVEKVDTYKKPLKAIDFGRKISLKLNNETFANNLARKESYTPLNFLGKITPKLALTQQKKMERLLTKYVERNKPDMLISCIPVLNPAFLNVAKKFDIPFLLATTDISIAHFTNGFTPSRCDLSYPKFKMKVPYSEEGCKKLIGKNISPKLQDKIEYNFGYPLRESFTKQVSEFKLAQLRHEYDIQDDENVVLVMMGGNAAKAGMAYARSLSQMKEEDIQAITRAHDRKKIRVICLCGDTSKKDNKAFMNRLNTLNKNRKNSSVTIKATKGTPKIAELTSLPEMKTVISKPGGGTLNEMIKKKMPMIYHVSKKGVLDWEKGGMNYGIERGYGKKVSLSKSFSKKLKQTLKWSFSRKQKLSVQNVPESKIDFRRNLRDTIRDMLNNGRA